MNNRFPLLLPADLILTRGGGAIRWFEAAQSGSARVGHSMFYAGNAEVVESVFPATKLSSLEKYRSEPLIVYRRKDIDLQTRLEIVLKAKSILGLRYGATKFPLFMLDSLGGWIKRRLGQKDDFYWFTQHFGITHFKVCSNMTSWAMDKKIAQHGYTFGRPWQSVNPDTQDDWCARHPAQWEIVYNSLPGALIT